MTAEDRPELLNGVTVVKGRAVGLAYGRGQMMVWLPAIESSGRKNPEPIQDGEEHAASNDSTSYFDWWPQGTPRPFPRGERQGCGARLSKP